VLDNRPVQLFCRKVVFFTKVEFGTVFNLVKEQMRLSEQSVEKFSALGAYMDIQEHDQVSPEA
jgi:hypothetical protein